MVSFALHDATNAFVFGYDTSAGGLALGTLHGTSRVRFEVGPIPVTGGKYWLTLGVHSRDNAHVYHVLDERYSFEVQQADGRRDQLTFPVTTQMEPLTDTAPTETTQEEKGSRNMTIGLILVSVTLAAIGAGHAEGRHEPRDRRQRRPARAERRLVEADRRPGWVWAGLAIFAVSAVLWLFALSRANLSFAYPFAALGYVIIVIASILFLERARAAAHWVGMALIVGGIL